jgi:polysaccharide export outer membrane protein
LSLFKLAALMFVAASLSATSVAQTQGDQPTVTLQPEDVIQIAVFNQPQLSLQATPIGRDGYVTAPFVGNVKAQGKTATQLANELAQRFKEKLYLKDPIVSVVMISFHQMRASVGGAVNHPGTYSIRAGDTIMTLLTQGGGSITDQSDLRRATLRRAGSNEVIPVDLYELTNRSDLSQNYLLKDGDELNIPNEGNNRILILGSILQPGAYPYHEPMTLADAISLAHGEVPYKSRFSKVMIAREKVGQPGQYVYLHADFVRFIRSGDQAQNILLKPGDLIYVPQTNTPDLQLISQLASSLYFVNFIRNDFFGIKF